MTEVISVRFRGGCKNYYFDPKGHTVKMGPEFGTCTQGNHEVADEAVVQPLCAMLRLATDADRRTVDYNRKKESEAFDICEKKIADHGLEMKLVNVSASFDGSKIIFFFTADGRVDFRELRAALLLLPVFGRVPARLHQDGQDPESQLESHQDLRHLRTADVLPEI